MVACEQQTHFRSSLLSLRKIAIFQRERGDDRKCVCCSLASRMGAVSFLLEICGSVPAITQAASCACSAGASTSKPAQLAARSHTLNTRIIRRARALTDFQAKKKKRQLTGYKDCKTYFFMLHFVTSSTKVTRFFMQSWCLTDVSFNL